MSLVFTDLLSEDTWPWLYNLQSDVILRFLQSELLFVQQVLGLLLFASQVHIRSNQYLSSCGQQEMEEVMRERRGKERKARCGVN